VIPAARARRQTAQVGAGDRLPGDETVHRVLVWRIAEFDDDVINCRGFRLPSEGAQVIRALTRVTAAGLDGLRPPVNRQMLAEVA
jgi:hypothetical protein